MIFDPLFDVCYTVSVYFWTRPTWSQCAEFLKHADKVSERYFAVQRVHGARVVQDNADITDFFINESVQSSIRVHLVSVVLDYAKSIFLNCTVV